MRAKTRQGKARRLLNLADLFADLFAKELNLDHNWHDHWPTTMFATNPTADSFAHHL